MERSDALLIDIPAHPDPERHSINIGLFSWNILYSQGHPVWNIPRNIPPWEVKAVAHDAADAQHSFLQGGVLTMPGQRAIFGVGVRKSWVAIGTDRILRIGTWCGSSGFSACAR